MVRNNDIVDVLVIGAGASGGAFSWSLADAGIDVMCLEQGDWPDPSAYPSTRDDWEIHKQTDFNPNPNFRGLPQDYPVNDSDSPIAPLMYNAVGGSTIHWSAHFPRLHPSDFQVRTLDGVADDWPVTYQQLEPYFDLNDRMMGVSGITGDTAYPPSPSGRPPLYPSASWETRLSADSRSWAGTGGLLTAQFSPGPTTDGLRATTAAPANWGARNGPRRAPTLLTGPRR